MTWGSAAELAKQRQTAPTLTEIVVVLDRSGSMYQVAEAMQSAFNRFIEDQRKIDAPCLVTLVQFDDEYEVVYANRKLAQVPRLALLPRNDTALLDALGRTLTTGQVPSSSKVIVIVITDGMENASREFNRAGVFDLIRERRALGWEFVFLGANQDAIAEGAQYGFPRHSTITFSPSRAGTMSMYSSVSERVAAVRSGNATNIEFTDDDRDKAMEEEPKKP